MKAVAGRDGDIFDRLLDCLRELSVRSDYRKSEIESMTLLNAWNFAGCKRLLWRRGESCREGGVGGLRGVLRPRFHFAAKCGGLRVWSGG
jgi:hypothetical protein